MYEPFFLAKKLVLLVTDVLCLCGVEHEVADGSNQRVNTEGQVCEDEVCPGSGGPAFRLQGSVVDDNAADPAQEEGQQKTNEVLVVHDNAPYKYFLNSFPPHIRRNLLS